MPFRKTTETWIQRLSWILVLVGPVLQLWCIHRFAVNVPIWDEWALVPFLKRVHEGGDWLQMVFNQHNEHRVAGLRLPLAFIAEWSNWNVIPEMYFGVGIQLLSLLGLWKILAPTLGASPLRFAPVSLLCFGLIGYQIFLYGMMFIWSMLVAATVWSLWLLSRQTWPGLAAAAACGFVASFTLNNGLLVWPIGLLLLSLGRDRGARRLAWLAAGIAVFIFYYWGYTHPGQHPPLTLALEKPLTLAGFFLANLGAAYGAGSYWASVGFGAGLILLLAWVWLRRLPRWRGWTREERALFGLAIFGLLSAAAVSVSRVRLGRDFALEPRYICLTILVSLAVYGILFGRWDPEWQAGRALASAFAALVMVGFLATTLHAREQIVAWSGVRRLHLVQLERVQVLPDQVLAGVFHAPTQLREHVAYMRPRRLGPFRESIGYLRLVRWQEGTPAGEIVAGRPVVQTFSCPVETLFDLAVPFATYQRKNRGTGKLVLAEGGKELDSHEFKISAVQPNAWVSLKLDKPLRNCKGKRLTLTVRSDDGATGSSVTVWTYPAYYEGVLSQPNAPAFTGRCLGLEINRDAS